MAQPATSQRSDEEGGSLAIATIKKGSQKFASFFIPMPDAALTNLIKIE